MQDLSRQVVDIVEAALTREGCELAEVKVSKYKNSARLQLFVYKEGGVSLDQCAHLSDAVGDAIDASDLFDEGYTLEVSSPGLDRPLSTARDFKYRVGETVSIGFVDRKRRCVTAEIVAASPDSVVFRNEAGEFRVALNEIGTAKIIF